MHPWAGLAATAAQHTRYPPRERKIVVRNICIRMTGEWCQAHMLQVHSLHCVKWRNTTEPEPIPSDPWFACDVIFA